MPDLGFSRQPCLLVAFWYPGSVSVLYMRSADAPPCAHAPALRQSAPDKHCVPQSRLPATTPGATELPSPPSNRAQVWDVTVIIFTVILQCVKGLAPWFQKLIAENSPSNRREQTDDECHLI